MVVSVRDLLAWVSFINTVITRGLSLSEAFVQGRKLLSLKSANISEQNIIAYIVKLCSLF
jgi:hypothetical protein